MINLICLGDIADHYGKVITASETIRIKRIPVNCEGDEVKRLQHPQPNLIVEDDTRITDKDGPAARYVHKTRCGCSLISSLV